MGNEKRVKFIYNPHSGMIHPENLLKRLIKLYFPGNLCEVDFDQTVERGHARSLSEKAVKDQFDIVVAIGGDGTINEVASGLVNTDVSLGVVPLGSGNGLARGLGIPLIIRRALRLITIGKNISIDVGKVGERYFFATAGLGFDAVVGKRFDKTKLRGPAPYYLYSVQEFFRYNAPKYEIVFDGRKLKIQALIVAIANTKQYGNNAIIAPSAKPDDGFLDLAIIDDVDLATTLFYLPALFTGTIEKTPVYKIFRSTKFDVYREFPGPYTLDGEVYEGDRFLSVTLLPRALNVIVANTFDSKK